MFSLSLFISTGVLRQALDVHVCVDACESVSANARGRSAREGEWHRVTDCYADAASTAAAVMTVNWEQMVVAGFSLDAASPPPLLLSSSLGVWRSSPSSLPRLRRSSLQSTRIFRLRTALRPSVDLLLASRVHILSPSLSAVGSGSRERVWRKRRREAGPLTCEEARERRG